MRWWVGFVAMQTNQALFPSFLLAFVFVLCAVCRLLYAFACKWRVEKQPLRLRLFVIRLRLSCSLVFVSSLFVSVSITIFSLLLFFLLLLLLLLLLVVVICSA